MAARAFRLAIEENNLEKLKSAVRTYSRSINDYIIVEDEKYSALGWAVKRNKPQIVEGLLAASVDINKGYYEFPERTPLKLAVEGKYEECAMLLLSHGASLTPTEVTGASITEKDWLASIKQTLVDQKERVQREQEQREAHQRRENEHHEQRELIWRLLREKNVDALKSSLSLSKIQRKEVQDLMVSGKLPLEGWDDLFNRASAARARETSLRQESAAVETRAKQLKRELSDLKTKRVQIRKELEETSQLSQMEPLLKVYAECEVELLSQFKEKLTSPSWNAELMSWNDLSIAFQKFHIPQWIPRLSESTFIRKNVEAVVYIDFLLLNEKFPRVDLSEKLDLLYVVDMLCSKRLDGEKHKIHCAVCSSENVEVAFHQQGVSKELFDKIRKRVAGLTLNQVIFWPVSFIVEGLNIDGGSTGRISRAVGAIKQIHSTCSE